MPLSAVKAELRVISLLIRARGWPTFVSQNLKIAPLTMSSLLNTVFHGSRNYGRAAQATPPVRRRILTPKPIEN